ncbi:MAG: class I SAM-dependent DNA methyltransferase, partial [Wujia sp.]
MEYLSLKKLCEELSISTATGHNWMKLGKLTPDYFQGRTAYFSKSYVNSIKLDIISGKNTSLRSRRNKRFISGNVLYNSYVSEKCTGISLIRKLLDTIEQQHIFLDRSIISLLVADCALHLLADRFSLKFNNQSQLLRSYINDAFSLGCYDSLIDALIYNKSEALSFCQKYPLLFTNLYQYEAGEDILGLLYISCNHLGTRKSTGSYYTPNQIVKRIIEKLDMTSEGNILDPSCGTGNFLIQLPSSIPLERVYGNDIDTTSVNITRINMALKFKEAPVAQICRHITNSDYLTEYKNKDFSYIIGNPPWGYHFSDSEKAALNSRYKTAVRRNPEAYDVFMEKGLSDLAIGGKLSFIVPEAILSVKVHRVIREIIMESCSINYLEYMHNRFDGVQCPCIILQLTATGTPLSTVGITVNSGSRCFTIRIDRPLSPDCFQFYSNDSEYNIIRKIKEQSNMKYLKGNADFALG